MRQTNAYDNKANFKHVNRNFIKKIQTATKSCAQQQQNCDYECWFNLQEYTSGKIYAIKNENFGLDTYCSKYT